MAKYKIADFDQSFSRLFLRSIEVMEDDTFDCLEFMAVEYICIPTIIEFGPQDVDNLLAQNAEAAGLKRFDFGHTDHYVIASSVRQGRAVDRPIAETFRMTKGSWLQK